MSQDIRRRLAARERLQPTPHDEGEIPAPLRFRRFSEGLEHHPPGELWMPHLGRFSEGQERLPETAPSKARVGRYSMGLDHEGPLGDLRVGRFSTGLDHAA